MIWEDCKTNEIYAAVLGGEGVNSCNLLSAFSEEIYLCLSHCCSFVTMFYPEENLLLYMNRLWTASDFAFC